MTQALKFHHELCRDEMPRQLQDCSYLKRIWLVLGLDEYGFGLVLKTSLSRGGGFLEGKYCYFPYTALFFFLFWMLYCGKDQRYHSAFFWHWKFPQVCLPLPYPCSKHARGHVQPPICPLPWNCYGALATKWFCGKWSVGIRVGSSFCFKSWVLWARLICRADF